MARGLTVGFGAQPYTLQCAPGAFNLLGYDASLPNSGAVKGFGLTGLPGAFALTGGGSVATVGGTFPAATPTFSPAGALFENAVRVTISCASAGTASIYYTTDGSTPTTASTPYPGPINVPASSTLQAIAIVPGFGQSAVGGTTYTISLNTPAGALALGYTQSLFNFAPQVSDIAITTAQWESGTFKLANRYYGTPGTGWTDPTAVATAQGVLALNSVPTSGIAGPGGGIYGQMPLTATGGGGGGPGALPYLSAVNGFYAEFHEAITNGVSTDPFEAMWLMPQEHSNGNLPYLEVDVQEGNYSTNGGIFSTVVAWASSGGLKDLYHIFNTPALDRSQFHRYGVSYDPVGKMIRFWCDDVNTYSVSTNQTSPTSAINLDSAIKNYHYYMICTPQSHSNTPANPYSMMVSNWQAWITPTGATLAAPTGVQVLYQGQTAPNTSTASSTWFVPPAPNTMVIQWNTVTGATQYKIYRSTNGAAATLLSTVAAGGGSTQTYTDATATNCVGVQPAPPPQFAAATSYAYYVSTVNASGEGSRSTQFSWILYGTQAKGASFPIAGTALYQELSYATAVTYGGSIGASGPCAAIVSQQFGAWLVALGNTGCNYNIWSGAFNFLSFDIWVTASNTFHLVPHVRTVGGDTLDDLFNSGGGNFSYSFPVTLLNQWVTIKIPLSTLRTDFRNSTAPNGAYSPGASILQSSIYKMDFQPQSSPPVTFGIRNYMLTVT